MNKIQHFQIISILLSLFLITPISAFEIGGHEFNIGGDDVAATVAGAVIGGALVIGGAAVIGVTAPVWAVAAGVVVCAVGVEAGWRYLNGKDAGDVAVVTGEKNVSNTNYINNTEAYQKIAGFKQYSEEASARDILELRNTLDSSICNYNYKTEGTLSDVVINMEGPEKIYGFSAFPISVELTEAITGSENKSYVDIDYISIYLVDSSGRKWNEKRINDIPKIYKDCEEHEFDPHKLSYNVTMKAPDPYIGKANSMISNIPNRNTLKELMDAEVNKFEIIVEVHGVAQLYKLERTSHTTEDGHTYTRESEEFDKTININTKLKSLDAWNNEKNGKYYTNGASASLPVDYINNLELIAYAGYSNGATSNIISRTWASCTHVYNSSSKYRFVAIGQPNNLEPVPVTITDDYRAVVLRLDSNSSTLVSQTPGNFHDMGVHSEVQTALNYLYNKNTETYETYFLVVADVDDGYSKVPIWYITRPLISVINNLKYSISDEDRKEIADLTADGSISESDRKRINEIIDLAEKSTKQKKDVVEDKQNSGYYKNSDAVDASKNAINDYSKALEYLQKSKTTDNPEDVKRYTYLSSSCYEPAGDYWSQAAEKYEQGYTEEAEALANNAKKLEELAKDYEPSLMFTTGQQIMDKIHELKAGLGISQVPDAAIIVILLIILFGIIYLIKR
ncbi:hypothetical protein [Methanococcus voltae]|uniref:Uncharacterized protein n=1 Tax=Methanococcus voltae (strain ATCC BAA-1334 / A3) TaxID=456320 RepID=D7DQP7_METV3|nr:hypothetical protein [Methanococcus voltae]MCS3900834.1 tetratricopeptide (TPR) repeat protein [Methanococcus voltae]